MAGDVTEVRTLPRLAGPVRHAVFSPIGDEGRALLVERRIAEAIRAGLLVDGERLPAEAELAHLLGVAPVTAREALVALRADGLVTTIRGRNGGSFVTTPHDTDLVHQHLRAMSRVELRDRASQYLVVGTGCAELAAERADPDEVEELRALIPAGSETDIGLWRRAETEFWLALAALTQSTRLTREVIRLEADFGTLLRLHLEDPAVRTSSAERLLALTRALEAGHSDRARALARAHLTEAIEALAERHAAMP